MNNPLDVWTWDAAKQYSDICLAKILEFIFKILRTLALAIENYCIVMTKVITLTFGDNSRNRNFSSQHFNR